MLNPSNFLSFLVLLSSFFVHPAADALSKSTITVAAVQLHTEDVGNFSKMRELVKQAKTQGADLVIFPEESVFGWLNPEVFLEAAPIPGKYSDQFAEIAKEEQIWLAAGLGEQGSQAGPGCQKEAHLAYNSGILVSPKGKIVLHHRQINVIRNAFDPDACKRILNQQQCHYTPGILADITCADTPFGKTSILVCADAFTDSPAEALDMLKKLQPDFVIIFWGITASTKSECGHSAFNATCYAAKAAKYLNNAFIVGVNGVGTRYFGRFLPSEYCGCSGYSTPTGSTNTEQTFDELVLFHIDLNLGS